MAYIEPDQLPSPSSFRHRIDLQLRFNDIDILGHLNNTVYFSFYDTGKAYYLEAVNGGKMNWQRVESVIANVNCSFIAPVFFGENVEICTRCEKMGTKSLTLFQMIVNKDTRQIKSTCRTVMVAFDPSTGKSTPLPERWRRGITLYEQGEVTGESALTTEKSELS